MSVYEMGFWSMLSVLIVALQVRYNSKRISALEKIKQLEAGE